MKMPAQPANPTVAEYAVGRIAALGIRHVFGLPGDYSFPIDDAIEEHPGLEWVISSNELNATYSADGYARVHAEFTDAEGGRQHRRAKEYQLKPPVD